MHDMTHAAAGGSLCLRKCTQHGSFYHGWIGRKVKQCVTYVVHSSVPMVEILDVVSMDADSTDCGIQFDPATKTCKFLDRFHSGPWSEDPKTREPPSKEHTCLGIYMSQR